MRTAMPLVLALAALLLLGLWTNSPAGDGAPAPYPSSTIAVPVPNGSEVVLLVAGLDPSVHNVEAVVEQYADLAGVAGVEAYRGAFKGFVLHASPDQAKHLIEELRHDPAIAWVEDSEASLRPTPL